MTEYAPIYTVGHSSHSIDAFLEILNLNQIGAIGDVRSSPYSRMVPQFNRDSIRAALEAVGIYYVFLGDLLGGRSKDEGDYEDSRVVYDRLKRNPGFDLGLERVRVGATKFRIALMCSEKEPLDCHRSLLLATELTSKGFEVNHILADGSTESHERSLMRLLQKFSLSESDLFRTNEEIVNEALARQEKRVAFTLGDSKDGRLGMNRLGPDEASDEFL